jgi:hypothetical protein
LILGYRSLFLLLTLFNFCIHAYLDASTW